MDRRLNLIRHGIREWLSHWRRPIILFAACVVTVTAVANRGRESSQEPAEARTLMLVGRGFAFVPSVKGMEFFADSHFVVRLGAQENAAYPIKVAVFFSGTGVQVSPTEVRRAITRAIAVREGATAEIVRGSPVHHVYAPSVTIAYDLWPFGGARSDIVLRCRHRHRGEGVYSLAVDAFDYVSTQRFGLSSEEHLFAELGEQLSRAAKLRCREAVPGFTAEAPGMVITPSEFIGRPAPPSPAAVPERP